MTKTRLTATRRLAIVAASLTPLVAVLAAASLGPWWGVALGALVALVAVALADAFLAVPPTALVIERRMPSSIIRGDGGVIEWRVTNPSRRPVGIAFADTLVPSLGVDRRVAAHLPGRGSVAVERELRPTRRGRFELGPVTVRCAGPLGLGARQRTVSVPDTLRVLPPFRSRRAVELRMATRRTALTGIRLTRHQGSGTDFEQLREYEPGDDPRHIDWSATARSDKVIVRSYAVEQNQPVTVLFDTGRVMASLVEGVPRLEHAMDAAVALATAVARSQDRLSLLAYDRMVRAEVPAGGSAAHVGRVTDAIFGLHPALVETDHAGALVTATRGVRRRSVLVLLTDLHETVVEESLAPALAAHASNHQVLVAAVRDPRLEQWVAAPPTDRRAMHLAGAAAAALQARDRAMATLESVGAWVIDEVPGRCAERVVDAYLELRTSDGRRGPLRPARR